MKAKLHSKARRRAVALALSLALVVGFMPGTAFAEEEVGEVGRNAEARTLKPDALPQEAPETVPLAGPDDELTRDMVAPSDEADARVEADDSQVDSADTQGEQGEGIDTQDDVVDSQGDAIDDTDDAAQENALAALTTNRTEDTLSADLLPDLTKGSLALNKTSSVAVAAPHSSDAMPALYRITLSKPGLLRLSFTEIDPTAELDCGLAALPPSSEYLYLLQDRIEEAAAYRSWYLPKGVYYLKIDTKAATKLEVTTRFSASKESFAEPLTGSNNALEQAEEILPDGKAYYGLIGSSHGIFHTDMLDYHKFTLSYKTNVSLKVTGTGALRNDYYRLLDGEGTCISSEKIGKTLVGELEKGTYYIEIGARDYFKSGGNYTIKMDNGPKLAMEILDSAIGKLKFAWTKVADAEKYVVYRSVNDGKSWKIVKTLNRKVLSFTTEVPYDENSFYKVCSIDSHKVRSPFSTIKGIIWS